MKIRVRTGQTVGVGKGTCSWCVQKIKNGLSHISPRFCKNSQCTRRKKHLQSQNRAWERWIKSNRTQERIRVRAWAEKNPDKLATTKARIRLKRKQNAGKSFTLNEWRVLKEFFGNICLCCGKTESQLCKLGRSLTPDHVVPLCHPSKILLGFRGLISNIQPLCHSYGTSIEIGCNNKKGLKIVDYRKYQMPRVGRKTNAAHTLSSDKLKT